MLDCSLTNLYTSFDALNTDYLRTPSTKDYLLNSELSQVSKGSSSLCWFQSDSGLDNNLNPADLWCRRTGKRLTSSLGIEYVKEKVAFMVTDDFVTSPLSSASALALLTQFGVADVARIKQLEVTLDIAKGMELLQRSLVSETVLTDIFLHGSDTDSQY